VNRRAVTDTAPLSEFIIQFLEPLQIRLPVVRGELAFSAEVEVKPPSSIGNGSLAITLTCPFSRASGIVRSVASGRQWRSARCQNARRNSVKTQQLSPLRQPIKQVLPASRAFSTPQCLTTTQKFFRTGVQVYQIHAVGLQPSQATVNAAQTKRKSPIRQNPAA